MSNKKLVLETIKNLIGLKAHDVKLGHGSFLTMGFGNIIENTLIIRGKNQKTSRAEWYLWIQSNSWELHRNESGIDIICSSSDDRTIISEKIDWLNGKTLRNIRILPSLSYTKFVFDDCIISVYSPEWYQDTDTVNWILLTPKRKALCVSYMHAWIEGE